MTSVLVQTVAGEAKVPVPEGSRNFPFVSDKPQQPPEGKLIDDARRQRGLSARTASRVAGISDTRWRHIVHGFQPAGDLYVPVSGPAGTVAHMARAVGVTPDQLREARRPDAAAELDRLIEEAPAPPGLTVETAIDPAELADLSPEDVEAVLTIIRRLRGSRGDSQGA